MLDSGSGDDINEYTLTTGFDISTAVEISKPVVSVYSFMSSPDPLSNTNNFVPSLLNLIF